MRSNPRSEEVIEIGKRIRDIRTNKKMSQADLADKANISLSQVSDIETGKSSMRLTTFIGIVEALQVSADVLLRTDIPEVNNIYKSEFAELLVRRPRSSQFSKSSRKLRSPCIPLNRIRITNRSDRSDLLFFCLSLTESHLLDPRFILFFGFSR